MTDTLSPQKSKIADDDGNAHFVYDDGCRAAAGFKGKTGDCVCRPIAIATGRLYQEVYDALNALGSRDGVDRRKRSKSSARTGIYKDTKRRYLGRRGDIPRLCAGSPRHDHRRARPPPKKTWG